MKNKPIIYSILLLSFTNCVNQKTINDKVATKHSTIYPITIELGALGKGANLPPTIIEINKDSCRISYSEWKSAPARQKISIATDQTEFNQLFSELQTEDLKGEKHYYNPFMRDGGYMKISNALGNRKFTNTFSSIGEPSNIKPDSIGLSKFENISVYSKLLFRKILD